MDALTLLQVNDLLGYWKKAPPTHLLIHARMKAEAEAVGGTPEQEAKPPTLQELHEIESWFS